MTDEDREQRLGRGLSALLGEDVEDSEDSEDVAAGPSESQGIAKEMPIELLRPNPYQPRQRVEDKEIDALADSIRENGILQSILVRRSPEVDNYYEIVAGERRWRAAQRAGLHRVPVVIRELTHRTALELALVENVQREDLTPLEEATGYHRLIENFGHTQEKLSQVIGKSRSHISNTLRLMELPDAVKEMLDDGRLTAGHARALVTAKDPEKLAREIVAKELNVRQAERLARRAVGEQPRRGAPAKDADTVALENDLAEALGLKVDVRHRAKGGGAIKIRYETPEQLEDVCSRLRHHVKPFEV